MDLQSTSSREQVGVGTNVHVVVIGPGGISEQHVSNKTCVAGHESAAALFADGSVDRPAELALGLDGGGGTDTGDRSLNNEDQRVALNRLSRSGATATIRAFVPSQLTIGTSSNTVDELGVVLESGDLLNHATISGTDLSGSDTTLAVTVDITIGDA